MANPQTTSKNSPIGAGAVVVPEIKLPKPITTKSETHRRRQHHRPSDIAIFPPRKTDIVLVRTARYLPSPRLLQWHQQQVSLYAARTNACSSFSVSASLAATTHRKPKILLSTRNLTWVKANNGVWVKVPLTTRNRQIVPKKKIHLKVKMQ
ncbi:hypothetical protein CORC01_05094 [Colletotrichum orchidophilum]|uniref:Uncharacterized protein n=1 Tax=Colletotrichum orchidophilum TaxID=1209926 RepID=A0A1G4BDT8_9PEZI|nr:uncharacterized protein CORC01_05094 [Colletotrichum orchidophilum]OHE99516.1 hypothetical protein CORC01_05094 [Colletotrichum orchidophilum]